MAPGTASLDKHPTFVMHSTDPEVGGPALERLVGEPITATKHFFVRSHAPSPLLDAATHVLRVDGLVREPLELSLRDLGERLERCELRATLQCAGNRRDGLIRVREVPGEIPWGVEGIGTARWSGWRLRDVLALAGIDPAAAHIELVGLDRVDRGDEVVSFGGSIPLEKALADEVLLADRMNGEPLPAAHGFPLRAVVPGYVGVRSVKWLYQVNVRAEPSSNPYQRGYSLYPRQMTREAHDPAAGIVLGELSVNSAICTPADGATLDRGSFTARGWSTGGGSRAVERVDVSGDSGASWHQATLSTAPGPWEWRLWSCKLWLPLGTHELCVRAVDSAANVQPADARDLWNFKGYMNNAWHRITVHAS